MTGEGLHGRLIAQLDTLVPFLALAHREGFDLIQEHGVGWLGDVNLASYESYRVQVAHSAFLLGYSYCEAYLADLARAIYRNRPKMLPGERQLKYAEIVACVSLTEILDLMIEREVRDVFYKSMTDVGVYFRTKFSLPWKDPEGRVERASLVRNCIIHNNSIVDERLAARSDLQRGDRIALRPEDVHEFGLAARSLTRDLFAEAQRRHLGT